MVQVFAFLALLVSFSAHGANLKNCTTSNGLEVVFETYGKTEGVAKYETDVWAFAPDELISIELAAGISCYNMQVQFVQFSPRKNTLTALCLNPGNTYKFEIPLRCK